MNQDDHDSIRTASKALQPSKINQIRNCLQALLSLEYTLDQSRVVVDCVRKIDDLLSSKTPSLQALGRQNVAPVKDIRSK